MKLLIALYILGFQQSCTLKDHIRTHNGESPYLCSECGKSFNNGSNLRQHMLRHSGIKPFACSECPSRFNCKGCCLIIYEEILETVMQFFF